MTINQLVMFLGIARQSASRGMPLPATETAVGDIDMLVREQLVVQKGDIYELTGNGREFLERVVPGPEAAKDDEEIALRMLVRFKELRRAWPDKPLPDIGWMLELLEIARSGKGRP